MNMITLFSFRGMLDGLGYYNGAEFETPKQAREYLAEANTCLTASAAPAYSEAELERLADMAIGNREHFVV